jgi:ribosome-associated translation inhibitor RaiA
MTIEIYTPEREVRERTINLVKEQLAELHKKNRKISKAEVHFRNHGSIKVCEIDIIIYGKSLLVQHSAEHFEKAVRETLKELKTKIEDKQIVNEPSNKVTKFW